MLFVALHAQADDVPQLMIGLNRNVVFSSYSHWSSSAEILHRLVSPLKSVEIEQKALRSNASLRDQFVDLSREQFAVYVPAHAPPQGYGLLVYVPPWDGARLPNGWGPVLERRGVIFISAAHSGNDAGILERREPLALLAAHNILRRFQIDAARVYIGGFSGGSRVALRIALAYPDLFRAAFLNAGSDPIGDAEAPLPPPELFSRFQETSRIVYFSGQNDAVNAEKDASSALSMRHWCVFDVVLEQLPWTGHEAAGSSAFTRALAGLDARVPPSMEKLQDCRRHIQDELDTQLQQIDSLIRVGDLVGARRLLTTVDTHYGGMATPRSVDLAKQLGLY